MPTYFFFSFGVLFKCIPWHTAKILFESLVHCEYKNTKPNIEIKQIKKKIFDFPFSSKMFSNMWKKLGKTTSKTNFLSHSWMLASDFLWEWDQLYKITEDERFSTVYVCPSLSNVMKLILILLVGFSCLTFINAMPMCKWLISVFKSEFNNLFSVFSGFVAPDNNIEDNQDLFENFWKRTQMKKMFSPFSRMAANVISGLTSSGSSNLKLIRLP